MMQSARDLQIAHNAAFQQSELENLRSQLKTLDSYIATLESAIITQSDIVSGARAVLGARGLPIPPRTSPSPSTSSTQALTVPRAANRARQRLWRRRDGSFTRHDDEPPAVVSSHHILHPCGIVYTPFRKRFEAPRQSLTGHVAHATIAFPPEGSSFVSSVTRGDRLWLLYWLDRNDGLWRLRVRPPRSKAGQQRVGLFATRSPNRPTPLGLSVCIVDDVDVEGVRLKVHGVDILDETPLIAVKHYDTTNESFKDVRSGWLDDKQGVQPLYYDDDDNDGVDDKDGVIFSSNAADKLTFIEERSVVDIGNMVRVSLGRTLRSLIRQKEEEANLTDECEGMQCGSLPVGAFRILYQAYPSKRQVKVIDVVSGMRREVCEVEAEVDPEAKLHLHFQTQYNISQ